MSAATLIDSHWVDAADPAIAETQLFRAIHPLFMTVVGVSDDLTELIFALQSTAYHATAIFARADEDSLDGCDFAAGEIDMTLPGADQPIGMCELLMRVRFNGKRSTTSRIALFPFVPFEIFDKALAAAALRRGLQTSGEAARRLRL